MTKILGSVEVALGDEYRARRLGWPVQTPPLSDQPDLYVSTLRSVVTELKQQYEPIYWDRGHYRTEVGERMGVLVGRFMQAGNTWAVEVQGFAEVPHVSSGLTHAMMRTSEIEEAVSNAKERFRAESLVGWYHTHPDMGLFLSEPDEQTYDMLFAEPWQLAMVFDPRRWACAYFTRRKDGSISGQGAPWREFSLAEDEDRTPPSPAFSEPFEGEETALVLGSSPDFDDLTPSVPHISMHGPAPFESSKPRAGTVTDPAMAALLPETKRRHHGMERLGPKDAGEPESSDPSSLEGTWPGAEETQAPPASAKPSPLSLGAASLPDHGLSDDLELQPLTDAHRDPSPALRIQPPPPSRADRKLGASVPEEGLGHSVTRIMRVTDIVEPESQKPATSPAPSPRNRRALSILLGVSAVAATAAFVVSLDALQDHSHRVEASLQADFSGFTRTLTRSEKSSLFSRLLALKGWGWSSHTSAASVFRIVNREARLELIGDPNKAPLEAYLVVTYPIEIGDIVCGGAELSVRTDTTPYLVRAVVGQQCRSTSDPIGSGTPLALQARVIRWRRNDALVELDLRAPPDRVPQVTLTLSGAEGVMLLSRKPVLRNNSWVVPFELSGALAGILRTCRIDVQVDAQPRGFLGCAAFQPSLEHRAKAEGPGPGNE